MRDPYEVLGLTKTASQADIKRAYRKLAKQSHPDRHGGDSRAQSRFAEIGSAYEILGNKDKRAQFDRGEIDAEGKPRFQGFEGFGGPNGFSGIDPRMFEEAFRQAGAGHAGGSGTRTFRFSTGPGGGAQFEREAFGADDILSSLFGGGRRQHAPASPQARAAKGTDVKAEVAVTLEDIAAGRRLHATLPTGKTVALSLPRGVHDGQTIRLKGQGQRARAGGPPGDALVTVRFVPHPLFRADGPNLRIDVPISLDEAVLGAKIAVPTLDGKVQVTVPPGTSGGKVLRLKGKGLPDRTGAGDLLVRLVIALPEKADPEFQSMMRKWRSEGRKSPRGAAFD